MSTLNILSFNANGIRAAVKNGFADWLKTQNFDVVCLQEIKVSTEDFVPDIFNEMGYECFVFPAEKKGYSGVGVFTKRKPDLVVPGVGIPEYDLEGRNLRVDFGDLSIMSAYFPSGTMGDIRQDVKMKYLDAFYDYAQHLKQGRKLIIAGDYNICHQPIDIHDPVRNKDVTGFKPEERAWMSKFFDSGFIDTFREFHPNEAHRYSWWSYRAAARKNNKGWRIDYISASENLKSQLKSADIFSDVLGSDHCPISCEIVL